MPTSKPSTQWSYRSSDKIQSWQLEDSEHHDQHLREPPFSDEQLESLAADLRSKIEGEVRFDPGSRALYATDASNYRQTPIGVVLPKHAEDVISTLEICRRHHAPVLSRGGGTSLAGQCCNVAVVMDMSKYMNEVIDINPNLKLAKVMPGTILDDLRSEAKKHDLIFGPDPATHDHCTLGGMIGNNSCGTHAQMAGKTSENIHELDIITYDGLRMTVGRTSDLELRRIVNQGGRRGEIYQKMLDLRNRYAPLIRERFPKIPRRVSGYNLDALLPENGFDVAKALVGSEGTLVTVLGATCKLVDSRPHRTLIVLGYEDVYHAADHVPEILRFQPIALEGLDNILIENMKKKQLHPEDIKLLPPGGGWLLVEFGARSKAEADAQAKALIGFLKSRPNSPSIKLFENPKEETLLWEARESGLGVTARVPGEPLSWPGWEDSAVPPDKLGSYLRKLKQLYDKYELKASLYGHFGQGCLHTRIPFDLTSTKGIVKYRSFMNDAVDLCLAHGGSLSGEHGDGQARAEFLPRMFGPELMQAFHEFKSTWDPTWKMNPGKIVHPYSIDENLRLGNRYEPKRLKTHFQFPDDQGFQDSALRCVGVGKCRRLEGGTMCPSFMATREERHSTRGRAHLLHEMLSGEVLKDGWKSDAVKDALDLCLACKGCKADCPVNVDMATYKAEFLSHYYEGKRRPIVAFSMGLIDLWARLASRYPKLVNFFTQTPLLRSLVKQLGGIDQRRKIPRFAHVSFQKWFSVRGIKNKGSPPVILWPDTFNNYFHPETAKAATQVLEAAGFQVLVPSEHFCCGRPLYDFGMLDRAKSYLKHILASFKEQIQNGVPFVVLEPSCYSVFKDELRNLMPHDFNGERLREQTFLLADFLKQNASDFQYPKLRSRALLHGHCHHKSVGKFEDEQEILKQMDIDVQIPDPGCCGMAGSFGFEKEHDHYDVSMKIGERHLLPAVRAANQQTFLVSDGFSCRSQILNGSGRETFHLAQVIDLGLTGKTPGQYLRESRRPFFKRSFFS